MSFQLAYPDITEERRGNTGTPGVWHFDAGVAGPAVMISALMHGNELCGAWALKALLAAGVRPRRGSLTLVFANLAAFDRFDPTRHDASRFVEEDMNRVWSTDRLADGSTLERARGAELQPWVARADWLLDLHSMHEPGVPLCLTGMLPRNIELARRMATPRHVIVDAGHRDGTRLRDYGQFGDAQGDARALLIECGFHGDPASVDVAHDQVARFLLAAGSVDPADVPAGWIQAPLGEQRVLQVTDAIVAPSMQVRFAEPWQGMETFASAGSVIGWADEQPILTPYDDCTLVMPSLRQLKPGVTVVRLARDYPG
ncbi:succinylglutamate desuccinylase/aspartoacylase family protein [Achromobacter sp. GG226]|uniref:succinylglutamate desuccinylase/aspartoacylase domain-containing protein n=1 Tax=Verticiella alkaliphila TaxID=2779529 RepID=UPI001C0D03F1|nr:succinylglutamate desuccinylase/aspartoacylase family protein [Verticiella sp. GG226]MBU4610802.1 succinylglutamate desuccinylase/aspartoacylase family protein [Verticiella sp. GG226]